MIKSWWRSRRSVPPAAGEPSVSLRVRRAAEEASRGGWEPVEHLTALLAEVAATSGGGPGRAVLSALGEWPRAVVRLDDHARRAWWYEVRDAPLAARVDAGVTAGAAESPVAVALASTHSDGRLRERAVAAILAAPSAELMPFLVLRTSDWARPVRDRARAGLALLVADDPAMCLPAMLPAMTAIDQRWRGTFAVAQATAALSIAPPEVRRNLAGLPHPASRRFVATLGLGCGWWSPDELVELAESGPDVRIRTRAAEAACRDAVWRRRPAVLHRLARNRRPEVRAVALTGLVRTGDDAHVVTFLGDPSPLARALARDAARRTGVDALSRYRDAVRTAATPHMIAGFAETASPTEAPLLDPLLRHPEAKVRAAAVRAVRHLDAADPARLVPMLRDPSAAVVRETAATLLPVAKAVPTGLLWDLLVDGRTAVRRAGYRLLTTGPVGTSLRAGLIAAVDADPRLASRARADLTGLARDATGSVRPSRPDPVLLITAEEYAITAEEYAELTALLRPATRVLGPGTAGRLAAWLDAAAAGQSGGEPRDG